MNKYLFLVIGCLLTSIQKVYCAVETVSPDLEQSLKSTSSDINFFSVVLSLLFVVLLIYVTGIIYSKLNMVGAKTVKEQLRNSNLNRAIVISTTPIGQNKNLHVIELNDKHYLIGSAPNSITLIKELGCVNNPKEELIEKPDEEEIDKAIQVLYGSSKDEYIEEQEAQEEFNVHKKYL